MWNTPRLDFGWLVGWCSNQFECGVKTQLVMATAKWRVASGGSADTTVGTMVLDADAGVG